MTFIDQDLLGAIDIANVKSLDSFKIVSCCDACKRD